MLDALRTSSFALTLAAALLLGTGTPRGAAPSGGLEWLSLRFVAGDAVRLPSPAPGASPYRGRGDALVSETLAALDASRDGLVHLETVRRAFTFALELDDAKGPGVARALEARLAVRALRTATRGTGDGLAWLDAGVAALLLDHHCGGPAHADAPLVERAAALAPTDGAVRLAAGLVVVVFGGDDRDPNHRSAEDHLRAAAEAARDDPNLRATIAGLPPWFQPPDSPRRAAR